MAEPTKELEASTSSKDNNALMFAIIRESLVSDFEGSSNDFDTSFSTATIVDEQEPMMMAGPTANPEIVAKEPLEEIPYIIVPTAKNAKFNP